MINKKRARTRIKWVFFLPLMILVIGCNRNIDFVELLTSPCTSPCWQTITPDVSTKADLESVLSNASIFDPQKQDIIDLSLVEKLYVATHKSGLSVSFQVESNIVSVLMINVGGQLLTQDILSIYGEPTFVLMEDDSHQHDTCYMYVMVYLEKGLEIRGQDCQTQSDGDFIIKPSTQGKNEANLHPLIPVSSIIMDSPAPTLEIYLRSWMQLAYVEEALYQYEEWHGFGFYTLRD